MGSDELLAHARVGARHWPSRIDCRRSGRSPAQIVVSTASFPARHAFRRHMALLHVAREHSWVLPWLAAAQRSNLCPARSFLFEHCSVLLLRRCSTVEAIARADLTIGSSDRGPRLRWAKEGVDD
jgi:hypothetical protein